jgi:hypothetical protein
MRFITDDYPHQACPPPLPCWPFVILPLLSRPTEFPNKTKKGRLEICTSCDIAIGWAYDPDEPEESTRIKLSFGGSLESGDAGHVVEWDADLPSEAGVREPVECGGGLVPSL